MRYRRQAKEYSFPDFSKMSFGGEQGYFGELEERATIEVGSGFVPLEQHMGEISLGGSPPPERRRIASSTLGF